MHFIDFAFWPNRGNRLLCVFALLVLVGGLVATLEFRRVTILQNAAIHELDQGVHFEAPCTSISGSPAFPALERLARESLEAVPVDQWQVESLVSNRNGDRIAVMSGKAPTQLIRYVGVPEITVEVRAVVACTEDS